MEEGRGALGRARLDEEPREKTGFRTMGGQYDLTLK